MIGLLIWLAGVALLTYEIITRHLWPYMLDFALCCAWALWVLVGAAIIAAKGRTPLKAPRGNPFSPSDIDRLIADAKQREAAQRART